MTAPQEEWTEWFQHDGKGCPCVGRWVQAKWEAFGDGNLYKKGQTGITEGFIDEKIATHAAWFWAENQGKEFTHPRSGKTGFLDGGFMEFRIKRPRALLDLIQLIADLPAPVAPIKTDGVIA